MKKLINGVVFRVKEKFKGQASKATNKDVPKHLQLFASPNCPCMQGDKDALNLSKSLMKKWKSLNSPGTRQAGIVHLFLPKCKRSTKTLMANLLLKSQNKMSALPISIIRIIQFYKSACYAILKGELSDAKIKTI